MYFAFLGHYTVALVVPAFLGVVIWLSSGTNQVRCTFRGKNIPTINSVNPISLLACSGFLAKIQGKMSGWKRVKIKPSHPNSTYSLLIGKTTPYILAREPGLSLVLHWFLLPLYTNILVIIRRKFLFESVDPNSSEARLLLL